MDLERRKFIKLAIAATGATLLASFKPIRTAIKNLPKKISEARKVKVYPGKIEPISIKEIKKPSRWLG